MNLKSLVESLEAVLGDQKKAVTPTFQTSDGQVRKDTTSLTRAKQEPYLFDYQKDLVSKVEHLILSHGKGLVTLPTGGGKTRTAATAVLRYLIKNPNGKVLWLAPTIELLDQASETLEFLWKNYGLAPDLDLFRNLMKGTHATVSLVAPHSLFGVKSTASLAGWDALVFDEAHQVAAPEFRSAVEKIQLNSPGVALIGLSATPGRTGEGESSELARIFDNNLIYSPVLGSNPVEFLQNRGILSQLIFKNLSKDLDLTSDKKLEVAVLKCVELASTGKKVLVFTESVRQSQLLAEALCRFGVPAAHVDGALEAGERKARIDAFGSGQVQVLSNQKLLTTGYDCPAVSDLVVIPTVGSPILFEQMVGRAARGPRTGGTSKSTVWQFADHLALHGLPQSYYRYKDYVWA